MNMLLTNSDNPLLILTYADTTRFMPHKPLLRVFHGQASKFAPTLRRLNQRGAAVAFAVNETNGHDRTAESITRIRAYFTEIDGIPTDQEKQAKLFNLFKIGNLEPSAVVETRNGLHAYWYSTGEEPVDPTDYKRVNNRIATYHNGDRNALDISRVLRLPGYYHMKNPDAPHPIQVIHENPQAIYTRDEIFNAFPAAPEEHQPEAPQTAPRITLNRNRDASTRAQRYLEGALEKSAERVRNAPNGNRNNTLNSTAYSLARYLHTGLITEEDITTALKPAALTNGLPEHEINSTIKGAIRAGSQRPREIILKKGHS